MEKEMKELFEALEEVKEKLSEAAAAAREAAIVADRIGAPAWVSGQLELYLVRTLEEFMDGEYQAGGVRSLLDDLRREADSR